jgi:glycosyltransferase involved in cell wall biosynthesis
VVTPDPEQLARKFDALYENRGLARELGENAYAELNSREISWDSVIARLLQ